MNRCLLALLLAACSPAWVRRTVDAAVDASLTTAGTDGNKARLAELLDNEAMQAALRETAKVLTEGSVDGLGYGPSDERITALSRALSAGFQPAMRELLTEELRPQAEALIDHALDRMLHELADARRNGVFEATAASIARAMTDTTLDALQGLLDEASSADLGAAMATVIEEDLAPAAARALEGPLRPALGGTANELSRQAFDGLAVAIEGRLGDAIEARVADRQRAIEEAVSWWTRLAGGLAIVSGALLALAITIGVWGRRASAAAAAREEAIIVLTRAIRDEVRRTGDAAIVEAVRERAGGTQAGQAIRAVLEDHADLKVRPGGPDPLPRPPGTA